MAVRPFERVGAAFITSFLVRFGSALAGGKIEIRRMPLIKRPVFDEIYCGRPNFLTHYKPLWVTDDHGAIPSLGIVSKNCIDLLSTSKGIHAYRLNVSVNLMLNLIHTRNCNRKIIKSVILTNIIPILGGGSNRLIMTDPFLIIPVCPCLKQVSGAWHINIAHIMAAIINANLTSINPLYFCFNVPWHLDTTIDVDASRGESAGPKLCTYHGSTLSRGC